MTVKEKQLLVIPGGAKSPRKVIRAVDTIHRRGGIVGFLWPISTIQVHAESKYRFAATKGNCEWNPESDSSRRNKVSLFVSAIWGGRFEWARSGPGASRLQRRYGVDLHSHPFG